jgi:16S rRNA (uracil1498-N3)-methyltransferase
MVSSLRLKKGDLVRATDGCGRIYDIVIEEIGARKVGGRILEAYRVDAVPPSVTVFQGVVKSSRMEFIAEQCAELGVSGLVPVSTERSVRRLGETRLERMRRIAVEAMKQSLGVYLPTIDSVKAFDDALAMLSVFDLVIVASEGERRHRLKDAVGTSRPGKVALWVGPEGGFTPGELDGLVGCGAKPFGLGDLRLRSETAAIASVAILRELLRP